MDRMKPEEYIELKHRFDLMNADAQEKVAPERKEYLNQIMLQLGRAIGTLYLKPHDLENTHLIFHTCYLLYKETSIKFWEEPYLTTIESHVSPIDLVRIRQYFEVNILFSEYVLKDQKKETPSEPTEGAKL